VRPHRRALFSSTPLDYKEATHVNVQPPEHWAELFARHSLYRDVDFDAGFITPWAARFRRSGQSVHRVVRDYERKLWLLRREATELRARVMEMRDELAAPRDGTGEGSARVDASQPVMPGGWRPTAGRLLGRTRRADKRE
jgi:hypothetical protein